MPLQLFVGSGTAVNVAAVLVGTVIGLLVGHRMSERTRETVTDLLGLFTAVVAAMSLRPLVQPRFSQSLAAGSAILVVLLALMLGGMLGSALKIEDRIEQLGTWATSRMAKGQSDADPGRAKFINGFVTATLIYCVGPMAILGSLTEGLGQGNQILLTKSLLDGFTAIAFASALGSGVMLAAVSLAAYQGLLTVLGWLLGEVLSPVQLDSISVAGGIILLGLAARLLNLKQVRVADLVPGLLFAPVLMWAAGSLA